MSKNKNALGVIILFLAALIWGLAFSAQSIGARYVNAYTFLAIRSWISFIAMIPVVYFFKKKNTGNSNKHTDKKLIYCKFMFGIFFVFCKCDATNRNTRIQCVKGGIYYRIICYFCAHYFNDIF